MPFAILDIQLGFESLHSLAEIPAERHQPVPPAARDPASHAPPLVPHLPHALSHGPPEVAAPLGGDPKGGGGQRALALAATGELREKAQEH